MSIEKLKGENADLKRKLKIAQAWMKQEVGIQVKKISKKHIGQEDYDKNVESEITDKIIDFVGEMFLLNIPGDFIENIVSAEILFVSLEKHHNFDGLGIMSSYHKACDVLVENFLTKGFRKYARKKKQTILRKNNILEKALHSVVNQGYILGIGRLYHIIETIKNGEIGVDYIQCFHDYLKKYSYLGDILLSDNFYMILGELIKTETLGKKRHIGKISFEETKKARKLLIGNFEDTNCFIYKIIETQKIEY